MRRIAFLLALTLVLGAVSHAEEPAQARPAVSDCATQAPRFVAVSGGVSAPQRLVWTPEMTLTSAIRDCGVPSGVSSPKKVKLIREGKEIGPFNWGDLLKDPSKDPKLLPGDQVIVPE